MIFAFLENGTLDVLPDGTAVRRAFEGIDVESGVVQFYDPTGTYLAPHFTKPNRTRRFLGIFSWVVSGEFDLRPDPTAPDDDIWTCLAETSVVNPNPWFANLDAVRQFLRQQTPQSLAEEQAE
jgi:hypothetical protein